MTTLPTLVQREEVTRRPASYEQYLAESSEKRIAEWVDGEMIEYMPPLPRHQEVTWFLFSLIKGYVEALDLGWVGTAPLEFRLWPGGPSREPDVFYVAEARRHLLTDRRFEGAPDIAVEVISTGSVREDRVRKFTEYEQAGVGEYWLIDPRRIPAVAEFYRRDEAGVFQPVEPDGDLYTSAVLPNFWIDVRWLRGEPLPSYIQALTAIFRSSEAFPPDLRAL
jgi:Uma2 family endonuclease